MSGLLKKRSCFDSASTERIGNDVILLSEGEFWTGDTSPYIADNTTAIFLLRGSLEMMINMHPCNRLRQWSYSWKVWLYSSSPARTTPASMS